jgi:asparagine synthase (glutamine-hydrolysing)
MRRALAGIVPDEILTRRRKAFVARGPRVAIAREWANLTALIQDLISSRLGIVEPGSFAKCLQDAPNNAEAPVVRLMRTLFLELWLRNLREHHITLTVPNRSLEIRERHLVSVVSD